MEKKRSIGVTIFGILCIIFGISNIFSGIKSITLLKGGYFNIVMHFVFFGILLVSGCGLLKLKEWSRKLILFHAVLRSILRLVYSSISSKKALAIIAEKYAATGIEEVPPSQGTMMVTLILPALLITGITIFFFTRPKVKAQFSPERGEAESKGAV